MNFEQLKLVEVLARATSLNEAAKELGTSQPRLTQQLQNMERELGCVLFHRSSKGLTLSEAGERFLPFARQLNSTFDAAQTEISRFSGTLHKRLRLGISITASLHLVPAHLLAFYRKLPDVQISVTRARPKQLLEGLEQGRFDLCFGLELPESPLFVLEEVFSTTMAGFSLATLGMSPSASLEQFCSLPLVLPPCYCGTRSLLDDALRRAQLKPNILMEIDDVVTLLAIVKSGACTILPRTLPNTSKSLAVTELRDFTGECRGTVLYSRVISTEAEAFLSIIRNRMGSALG